MTSQAAPAQGKGWAWFPWAVAGSLGVVFMVNGALFWFAKSTFPGVAATKPYEVGAAYNSVLADAARQEAQGWRLESRIEQGHIVLDLVDRDGAPLDKLSITGWITRPVGSTEAFPLSFTRDAVDGYRSEQTIPAPGQWDMKMAARQDGAITFTAARRLIAP